MKYYKPTEAQLRLHNAERVVLPWYRPFRFWQWLRAFTRLRGANED
jgi:hypothetical protein